MRFSELIRAAPWAEATLPADPEIASVVDDSRKAGPGSLFVAVRGLTVDGHDYIPQALARGAAAVVIEEGSGASLGGEVPRAVVPDSREALAWLAAAASGHPARRLRMIGVTGTDGKTTTAHLILAILRAAGIRAGALTTVGALTGAEGALDTGLHTTTPGALEIQAYLAGLEAGGATHAVIEATSHGLAQHRVTACEWDVAVATNITHEHLDYHGSQEAYREAKARLFRDLGVAHRKPGVDKVAILNADDAYYDYLRKIAADRRITYGRAQRADVRAEEVESSDRGLSFQLATAEGRALLESPLVGEFNVHNILAAAAVGISQGLPLRAIQEGVGAMAGVAGRMERIDMGQGFTVLVDFAHTPNSLEEALAAARRLTPGRLLVVFGCAGLRDRAKRPLMGAAAARLADGAVITAEDPRTEDLAAIISEVAAGCGEAGGREGRDFWRVPDRAEAIAYALGLAREGDTVLVAGKGHERSMCFGETEVPWSDQEAARAALARLLAR